MVLQPVQDPFEGLHPGRFVPMNACRTDQRRPRALAVKGSDQVFFFSGTGEFVHVVLTALLFLPSIDH